MTPPLRAATQATLVAGPVVPAVATKANEAQPFGIESEEHKSALISELNCA